MLNSTKSANEIALAFDCSNRNGNTLESVLSKTNIEIALKPVNIF